jgi:hypothetical protein
MGARRRLAEPPGGTIELSYSRAQRSHRSAIRVHTVLFSGLRVNLAMSSHSAANRKNFSAGSIGLGLPVLVAYLTSRTRTHSKGSRPSLNSYVHAPAKAGGTDPYCALRPDPNTAPSSPR